jgi:hypothetical protein
VLSRLQYDTAQHRSAFLDLLFLRKKRQREGTTASRQWYVGVDAWIAGTLAATEAAQDFYSDEVGACCTQTHAFIHICINTPTHARLLRPRPLAS